MSESNFRPGEPTRAGWASRFHLDRRRTILRERPEVRALMGPRRVTAVFVVLLVALQLGIAASASALGLLPAALLAYVVGAFVAHALGVLIHECAHNLVFATSRSNKALAIFANLPLLAPAAVDFRNKHLLHHKHLGEGPTRDFQFPTPEAAGWVGHSRLRRLVWLSVGSIVFPKRPIERAPAPGAWHSANLAAQVCFCVLVLFALGWQALLYLALSALFAFGPHPLGMRGYAEHVIQDESQPTASYYGRWNRLSFNVGYHVEHHDFPAIPWMNLPRLRELAAERYSSLTPMRSWVRLLYEFLAGDDLRVDTYVRSPPSEEPARAHEAASAEGGLEVGRT